MVRANDQLEEIRTCDVRAHKPKSWVGRTSQCVARVYMERTNMSYAHKGTATHIGNGYFLTAAHVLRFQCLNLDNSAMCTAEAIEDLKMMLLRSKSGTNGYLQRPSPENSTYAMEFHIVAFTAVVAQDLKDLPATYQQMQALWQRLGKEGLMPLPLGYQAPHSGDLALIRVFPQHRQRVKSSYALPAKFSSLKDEAEFLWCGANAAISENDFGPYPNLAPKMAFINEQILLADRISYFVTKKERVCQEESRVAAKGSLTVRFHSSNTGLRALVYSLTRVQARPADYSESCNTTLGRQETLRQAALYWPPGMSLSCRSE